MGSTEFDWIRHGLTVARKSGFTEVELEHDGVEFSAVLGPIPKSKAKKPSMAVVGDLPESETLSEIVSPCVGYVADAEFKVGQAVKSGEVLASVQALGHATDVESRFSGEITEVLVASGDPVDFGQVLARVKEA